MILPFNHARFIAFLICALNFFLTPVLCKNITIKKFIPDLDSKMKAWFPWPGAELELIMNAEMLVEYRTTENQHWEDEKK